MTFYVELYSVSASPEIEAILSLRIDRPKLLFAVKMAGNVASSANILNVEARAFLESFQRVHQTLPDSVRKSKAQRQLTRHVVVHLKVVPLTQPDFSMQVTGRDLGPLFLQDYLFKDSLPQSPTKLALNKCGLGPSHAVAISALLCYTP